MPSATPGRPAYPPGSISTRRRSPVRGTNIAHPPHSPRLPWHRDRRATRPACGPSIAVGSFVASGEDLSPAPGSVAQCPVARHPRLALAGAVLADPIDANAATITVNNGFARF